MTGRRENTMTYWKMYKEDGATSFEITKDEAKRTLEGYWDEGALNDIFENEKPFRLYTPFAEVETKTENGMMPMAGFYGVCG